MPQHDNITYAPIGPWLVTVDELADTMIRDTVAAADVTVAMVHGGEEGVLCPSDFMIDETERLGAGGEAVDLAQTFAFPVPFLVICELLGLPAEEREKFRGMASARFDVTGGGIGTVGAVAGSRQFLFEETARQRQEPGPGLIGR